MTLAGSGLAFYSLWRNTRNNIGLMDADFRKSDETARISMATNIFFICVVDKVVIAVTKSCRSGMHIFMCMGE